MHIMVHPPKVGSEGNIDYIIQESIYFWSCTLTMVKDHNILRFFIYLLIYFFYPKSTFLNSSMFVSRHSQNF